MRQALLDGRQRRVDPYLEHGLAVLVVACWSFKCQTVVNPYPYAPIISRQDRTRYIAATFAVLRNYSSSRRTIGITWVAKASRVPLIPPSGEGDGRTNI